MGYLRPNSLDFDEIVFASIEDKPKFLDEFPSIINFLISKGNFGKFLNQILTQSLNAEVRLQLLLLCSLKRSMK